MLRRLGQSLRIGVVCDSLSLLLVNRWLGSPISVLAELPVATYDKAMPALLAESLRQLLAGHACAHMPTTIVLSDELVRLWQVPPPQGKVRLSDIKAAAALRFQSLYGESLVDWTVTADWHARLPFLAAGIPNTLLAVFEQQAHEHQLALVEIAPQFILAWNRWRSVLKPGAWFAQVQDNLLTLGVPDGQRLCSARSIAMPELVDLDWLNAHLMREALLLSLPHPTRLYVCGQPPESWFANDHGSGIECCHLDQARRGMKAVSSCVALAQTGVKI